MESIRADDSGAPASRGRLNRGRLNRGRLNRAIKESLRDLGTQLSQLNHSVGTRLDLKATDLECLDLISRHGPIGPGALAKRAGVHPATMTGVLDRLERGGWIERGRDLADRRGVVVRLARGRGAEVLRLYLVESGMNTAMDEICAQYDEKDLKLLVGFLRRTADAGRAAAERLAGG
jgi:DNA-binding MarR family transcriptional regulator